MGVKINQPFMLVLAAITLSFFVSTSNAYNPPKGPFATRFWDCCRSAFSYKGKAPLYAAVDTCEKDGVTLIPESKQMSGKNGCDDGGNQFVCNCIQPWLDTVDSELAYGFGAYNIHDPDGTIENACYYVEFLPQDPNGKTMKVRKMILQNINTSQGLPKGSWDFNLAGGGVGDYNKGCSNQWGSDWGQRFGGVDNEQACCKLPEGLRSSCLFRFVYFGDNPGLSSTPKRVRCPTGIIDRSGAQRQDDVSVAPYSGKMDKTGYPAPDKYQRNRAVCQNVDPLGVVSSICGGGSGDGGRLPKGYGMVRQDSPGAQVPDESESQPQPQPQLGGGAGGVGTTPDPNVSTVGGNANAAAPGPYVPGVGGGDAGNSGNGRLGGAGKPDGANGGKPGDKGIGSPDNGLPGNKGKPGATGPPSNVPGVGGQSAQPEGYGAAPDPKAIAGGGFGGPASPFGPQPTKPDGLGGNAQPGTPFSPLGALSRHRRRTCSNEQH